MQYVKNGPDIPDRLLHVHEDGRVVFFCGAGISYPAGLKGFDWLAAKLYQQFRPSPSAVQQAAIDNNQFDTAIGLLEADVVGGREAVRRELARILTPTTVTVSTTATHRALITLGKTRSGAMRLVTTNFDPLFEHVIKNDVLNVERYRAPLLPVPKNRWNGLVYLHGLLTKSSTADDLNHLVVSSGDFGLAYLTERWSARFVSELFRSYTVCFVGYSLNDPVLRYMMDALAADRLLGESPPEMFAFGSYKKGKEGAVRDEWMAKNVTPILYPERDSHRLLHKTLQKWAASYRDGVRGKESIVVECARTLPQASTKEDDFVGRLLWALADPSGLPAKRFSDFDPVPALDWLGPLSERRFKHQDLTRFGVPPHRKVDGKLQFALLDRPSPYDRAGWMRPVMWDVQSSQWDEVMFHLARWLLYHLDDPKLLLWVAKQGGRLHPQFRSLIERQFNDIARWRREGNGEELARLRARAPNSVPRPTLGSLWQLALADCLKSPGQDVDLYEWRRRLNRDGLTPALRMEWRELLAPRITLREPFRLGDEVPAEPQRLRDLIDWEIVLASDHVHSALRDGDQTSQWRTALPELLDDTQRLLRDLLDVMQLLGDADDRRDRSHWHLPSISAHRQNNGIHGWTVLIELLRDSWLAVLASDSARAHRITRDWWGQPFPTFKRLALFAATHDVAIRGEWVDWLLQDEAWWLWSVDTKRETMRLLVLCGKQLPPESLGRLEAAILNGPPRAMFRDDLETERWADLVDHNVWLRLAKLAAGGTTLGNVAQLRLDTITAANPELRLAEDERDEFSHWMSSSSDPDFRKWQQFERVPRFRRDLVEWLKKPPSTDHWHENDWRVVCREKFATAACSLCALAQQGDWPIERWREALQAWSEEKYLRRSWRYLATTVQRMPDEQMQIIAHSVTWWLEAAAKVCEGHEAVFLDLSRRFLAMDHRDGAENDRPVTRAINHPIGQVAQALLHRWFRQNPADGQGLPDDLKAIFTALCDTAIERYGHARVLLAAHAIALFRVDRDWAVQYLLPFFDWRTSVAEARGAWEGFLWSPRLYHPLFAALKAAFLETAQHYDELGEHGRQYAAILTYIALDPADTFTATELHEATRALPQEGLLEASQALVNALEGAAEQREHYWANRIYPYWQRVWPKSRSVASKGIAEHLARLAIAADNAFPQAVATVRDWLQPVEYPHYVVNHLHEAGLCGRFPEDALTLLDVLINDQRWPPSELGECLDAITVEVPSLANDPRFLRLMEYLRRYNRN